MLAVMFKIQHIDYEETLKALFPLVAERMGQPGCFASQLIRSLGENARPLALGVLSRLRDDRKDDLLVHCVNAYEQVLTRRANEELNRNFGSCFRFGAMWMERDEALFLQIRHVQVAYGSLSELLGAPANPLLRMVGAAGGHESLEAAALERIRQKETRQKLLGGIQTFLNRHGIILQVEDMDVVQESGDTPPDFPDCPMNEQLKTALCDALAGYLGELLSAASAAP